MSKCKSNAKKIYRDVAVLGGGASGCYTAVQLRDAGVSVIVVEKIDRLGGATQTYHDPATGQTTDIGVVLYPKDLIVTNFFGKFNVPLAPFPLVSNPPPPTQFVDFRTGLPVAFTPPQPASLPIYFGLLEAYNPYIDNGYGFTKLYTAPPPIFADLISPFGDFVTKYGLQDMVLTASEFGQGLGNILTLPTVYVMKNFSLDVVTNLFADSFLSEANHNNSLLYEKITCYLGKDVLLNAHITDIQRKNNKVKVYADTPEGPVVIIAKKIVVTFPPTLKNLEPLHLSPQEESLFGQFKSKGYATSIVKLENYPNPALTIQNIDPQSPYGIPDLPGCYSIYPTGLATTTLFSVKYGADFPFTSSQATYDIKNQITRLQTSGTYPTLQFVDFAIFRNHTPFELNVSADDINNYFYAKLNALQGTSNTFYNGAAFVTQESSALWHFTDNVVVPLILASLQVPCK